MASSQILILLLIAVLAYFVYSGKISLGGGQTRTFDFSGITGDGGGDMPSSTPDLSFTPVEPASETTTSADKQQKLANSLTTLFAAVGIGISMGVVTGKIDEHIKKVKERAKLSRTHLDRSIERGGEKIVQRTGAKLGVRAGETVAVKAGTKVATRGTATAVQTGVAAASASFPPLAAAEIAFTLFTGTMDSLDLGGFSKLSNMDTLNGARDTINDAFKSEVESIGGQLPLVYGPLDKLTEAEYDKKMTDEALELIKSDIEKGVVKSDADFTDDYYTKKMDDASISLCKKLGGDSRGVNKCSFKQNDCVARWPSQIGDTYYEYRDGVCQVRPSIMRQQCEGMGLGVSYDMATGSCKLSEAYCGRYAGSARLDGKGDCYIDKGQDIAEALFGRTFVRSIVNIFDFKNNYEKCPSGTSEPYEFMDPLMAQYFCSGSNCPEGAEMMTESQGVGKKISGICYKSCNDSSYNPGAYDDKGKKKDASGNPKEYVSYWGTNRASSEVAGMCYEKCGAGYNPTSNFCTWNGSATSNDVCPSDYPVRQGTQCFKSSVKKLAGGAVATTVPPEPDDCPDGYNEAGVGLCSKYKETCTAGVVNCKYTRTRCYCTKVVEDSKVRGNSCPNGYSRTGPASCQADTVMAKLSIPRHSFSRVPMKESPYKVFPKKRKAPFPSTSESDFKNSTLGKYIQGGINSIRDGDPKGFGVAMGGMFLVNNPVFVGLGFNEMVDQGTDKTKGYSSLL